MRQLVTRFAAAAVLAALAGAAQAQTPASELEPAVNTSAPVSAPAATPSAAAKPPATPATPARPAAAAQAQPNSATPVRATGKAMDRLELEATQITGNRELPKVMYVVPWRRADMGDLLGRPANSLLDEALTPIDRDVFRRQSQYYEALQPDQATAPK